MYIGDIYACKATLTHRHTKKKASHLTAAQKWIPILGKHYDASSQSLKHLRCFLLFVLQINMAVI